MARILSFAVAALATACFVGPASAQIYKCTEGGQVVYTQTPCSDESAPLDLGPNAETAIGAHEQAMQREIERLRADLDRMQREQSASGSPPSAQFGRTQADLQAEMARSQGCREATRAYQLSANSVRKNDLRQRRTAMYAACGMQEPDDSSTRIIVR